MSDDIVCPCCGSKIASIDDPIGLLKAGIFTDIELDILDKLITEYPRDVRKQSIIDFIYAFRPQPETDSFKVHIHKLRKKLLPLKWNLYNTSGYKSGRGNTAKYKLERIKG